MKQINFDNIEMLDNLQADINQIILTTTLNRKNNNALDNACDIQHQINNIILSYRDYLLNK